MTSELLCRNGHIWDVSSDDISIDGPAFMVCPICLNTKQLQDAELIDGAILGGTVPMWAWIGDEGATAFSY